MILFGTLTNVALVLAGSMVGLYAKSKLPQRIVTTIFQAIGVFTLYMGVSMAMKTHQVLIPIFSLIIGAALGEWADLDAYIGRFGAWAKRKTRSGNEAFAEGLTSAFLLFCMGSMTILGAFEEGTRGDSNLLVAKSVMDGFSALALSSALGLGVAFSVIPLFIFQGGLTLLAGWLGNQMPTVVVDELTASGGLILLALALSILDIKKIKVVNFLPALVVSVVLAYLFQ